MVDPDEPVTAWRGNVPAPITSFVGPTTRARRDPSPPRTRAASSRSPASAGWARPALALQVASELAPEFPDGVWLVELAALADPALLPHTIVDSLGIPSARPATR